MSAHTIGTPAWYEANPAAPSPRDLALDAAEQQPTPTRREPVAQCRDLTHPGDLCSVCWTTHTTTDVTDATTTKRTA